MDCLLEAVYEEEKQVWHSRYALRWKYRKLSGGGLLLPIKIDLPEGFLKEEIRCGYTVSTETKKLWAVELDLLAEFDRVCRKNGLQYFVDGGTLLGAVRHQGFIPWDDDIDLAMLREDYEKLEAIAEKEFQHPYFFQTPFTDPGLVMGGSRLRNSDTTLISDFENKRPYKNKGIFIDIFVLDEVPDSERKIRSIKRFLKAYWRVLRYAAYYESYFCCGRKTSITQKLVGKISMALKQIFGIERLCRWYEDYCSQWAGTRTELLCSLKSERGKRIYRKQWYKDVLFLPFEYMEVPVPKGYKESLTAAYGDDYMVMKQISATHRALKFDVKTPYEEYAMHLEASR